MDQPRESLQEPEILEAKHTHQEIARTYNWRVPITNCLESKTRETEIASIQDGEGVFEVAARGAGKRKWSRLQNHHNLLGLLKIRVTKN